MKENRTLDKYQDRMKQEHRNEIENMEGKPWLRLSNDLSGFLAVGSTVDFLKGPVCIW